MESTPSLQTSILPSAGSPQRSLTATRLTLAPYLEGVGISEIGIQRTDNQDAIRMTSIGTESSPGALFAIADGMGGFLHGRFASHVGLQIFMESCLRNIRAKPDRLLRQAMEEAHFGIHQAMQKLNISHMGTTLTAAWIRSSRIHLAHIGDSRAYLLRAGQATCLTRDHSTAGEMFRMRILSADKVRDHPRRSELTRGLGLGLFVQPDVLHIDTQPGDRLILCTDGVWSVIEDAELAALSSETPSLQEFSRRFVDLAMERGSDDNVSAVGIQIGAMNPVPAQNRFRSRLARIGSYLRLRTQSRGRFTGDRKKSSELRML